MYIPPILDNYNNNLSDLLRHYLKYSFTFNFSMQEMKFLQELDLSSNRMCHFNNTLTWLKKGTKALLRLNMKYNPFMDIHSTKHLPYIAKLFFPNLECCNDADCKGEIAANIYLDSTSELKVKCNYINL